MKFRVTALNVFGCMALGCLAFGSAQAHERFDDTPRILVEYDDLNLDTDPGAKALYVRILSAAKRVCPPYLYRDLKAKSRAVACQKMAVERAVGEVNHPNLAAIHTVRRAA